MIKLNEGLKSDINNILDDNLSYGKLQSILTNSSTLKSKIDSTFKDDEYIKTYKHYAYKYLIDNGRYINYLEHEIIIFLDLLNIINNIEKPSFVLPKIKGTYTRFDKTTETELIDIINTYLENDAIPDIERAINTTFKDISELAITGAVHFHMNVIVDMILGTTGIHDMIQNKINDFFKEV